MLIGLQNTKIEIEVANIRLWGHQGALKTPSMFVEAEKKSKENICPRTIEKTKLFWFLCCMRTRVCLEPSPKYKM